jgi:hypothetical protein
MSNRNRRKRKLVRMLRKAVDIVYGPADRDLLGLEPDTSETEARKLLKVLEMLAIQDPRNRFGPRFLQLQLRIFQRLRFLLK